MGRVKGEKVTEKMNYEAFSSFSVFHQIFRKKNRFYKIGKNRIDNRIVHVTHGCYPKMKKGN